MDKLIYQDILICPECLESNFEFNISNNKLICKSCNREYQVKNSVPIMLIKDKQQKQIIKEQEQNFSVVSPETFDYVNHYQKDAYVFDYFEERTGATQHSERRIREYIKSKAPKNVRNILDVGSGSAWVAGEFCPLGTNVYSIDISLKNTITALEKYPFENHYAIVADAFLLPFKENTFDCIIASEIIEHVVDPEGFVKCLFKVLKPGGILLGSTPYKEKIKYMLCVHCNKMTPQSAHINSFDENRLLKIIEDKYIDSFNYYRFGNKVLIYLRTYVFLKIFSFRLWKIIDKIFNRIYFSASTILVRWVKKH
ncbi:MAG: methyltransferase domain-containing protein [Bacteroidales bacterium]|nr:methyltransferase domain-containing protein [Bacteroidales bacterium]